jgi:hypothetical protein
MSEAKNEPKAQLEAVPLDCRVRRRIVCAALRAADGDVIVGVRHYSPDMHKQIEARVDGVKFHHLHGDSQGFVDQFGEYLTRDEAFVVALAAGQITTDRGVFGALYSEHLY